MAAIYQALYRKYRPLTFDDVWGQEHITEALKAQVSSGRLSHAYLFVGTRGTGKTTCAKLLARAVNCEHPVNGSPCNECPACRGILDGTVMDVVEIDAASNNGVDNIRALRDEAVFSPATVKKRVYIVDEVHMLSTSAFNALLKILEEPPEHLMFILATTELRKVPATIVSRCQRYNFRRLDADVISKRLDYVAQKEVIKLTPGASRLLARMAEGGMRDALSLLDQCSGREVIDEQAVLDATGAAGEARTTELMETIAAHDAGRALEIFSTLWADGKDPAGVLSDLSSLIRDTLLLSVAPKGASNLVSGSYDTAALRHFASLFTREELLRGLTVAQNGLYSLRDNPSPRTAAELAIISLCSPELSPDGAALSARLSRVEAELAALKSGGISVPRVDAGQFPVSYEKPAVPDMAQSVDTSGPHSHVPAPDNASDDGSGADEAPPPPDDADVPWAVDTPPEPAPRPARAEPVPEHACEQPSPAPAAAAPDAPAVSSGDNGDAWRSFIALARKKLPIGIGNILTNSALVHGDISGDAATLYAEPGFAYDTFSQPRYITGLQTAVKELLGDGASISVVPSSGGNEIVKRNLEELRKFDIVKFTGKGGKHNG